jgi:hypothetical protein
VEYTGQLTKRMLEYFTPRADVDAGSDPLWAAVASHGRRAQPSVRSPPTLPLQRAKKVRIRNGRWISLSTIVARTEGYTYNAIVWDSPIVQGPFPVAPRQTLT